VLGGSVNSPHHRRPAVLASPPTYNYLLVYELIRTETSTHLYYNNQVQDDMQYKSKVTLYQQLPHARRKGVKDNLKHINTDNMTDLT